MDIFKTNGIKLTSIADGTVDNTSSPLSLPARNVSGYGKILNENLIKILENFADVTPPVAGILGQLWYDTNDNRLYVKSSAGYQPLAIAYKMSATPENPNIGEIWWDTSKKQLKVFDGIAWNIIGPGYESSWGETGVFSRLIQDTLGVEHLVVSVKIANEEHLIINRDLEFYPQTPIDGFTSIKPGINVSTRALGFLYNSSVENSNKLGNVESSKYLRNDQDGFVNGDLSANSISIGQSVLSKISVVGTDEKDLIISNEVLNSSINFELFIDGSKATVLSLDSSGQVLLNSDPTNPLSAATKGYVDVRVEENRDYIDSKFDSNGILPIHRGGHGSTTIEGAREALRVPSTSGIGAIGKWNIDIDGVADVALLSRNSESLNEFVESTDGLPDTIARRDSSGDLKAVEFIGVSTSARYADLAEKYLADRQYDIGTVVAVGGDKEITACEPGSRAIGAISENPAYMMNSGLEGGVYVALKGRVPVKVAGPVKKGDRLAASNDGCAEVSKTSNDVFAIALESSDNLGVKLVECVIL